MSPAEVQDTPEGARAHLLDAREFLTTAEQALADGRRKTAVSNAAIAGIRSSDAISISALGRYSTSPNHLHAVTLLRQSGPIGDAARAPFERLMARKNPAQYQRLSVAEPDAEQAVDDARTLVALATEALAQLP